LPNITQAFTDENGGYYQTDEVGVPAWAKEMTPRAVQVPPEPLTYKELRAAEYNRKSPGEQFAMQYDDAINKTTTWVDWQTEIKTRISKQ